MKIRLLLAALCMLSLPMWFSSASGNQAPFAPVALAGHTLSGGWCQCGCPGCGCDPEEQIEYCLNPGGGGYAPSDATLATTEQKTGEGRVSEIDFGSSAIFAALALFAWSRTRE